MWDDTCSVSNSYWIKETSGQQDNEIGVPKTISGLTKQATYGSGWDFTNTWIIDEGKSLAYLRGRNILDAINNVVANYPV